MFKYNFQGLTGHVITREDFEYENSRKQWNRAIEKYPLVIVYCIDEEDIKNSILWARKNQVPIRIRSGGHHYEGFSTGNDVIVIDVSKLNKIEVCEEKGFVKIQGGVRNRELYEAVCTKGYPFPGGGCPTVGAVGYTLGGGWGYSSRFLGLGCDSLLSAELIDYEGCKITADNKENTELFWALRGAGGGNFGVVTSLTFKLPEKLEKATLINMDFPNRSKKEVAEIFKGYQGLFKNLDTRINFKMAAYNSLDKGLGIKFTGVFYGNDEEAKELLLFFKGISGEAHITMDYSTVYEVNEAIQNSHPDYESYKSAGRFVYRDFTREEVNKLLQLIEERAEGAVYTAISLYGLGGRIAKVDLGETAFSHRKASFILGFQTVWEDAEFAPQNKKWFLERYDYIGSITQGSFVNFPLGEVEKYETEYYGSSIEKLRKVREKYDPKGIFAFEQCIK